MKSIEIDWKLFSNYLYNDLKLKKTKHGDKCLRAKFNLIYNYFTEKPVTRATVASFFAHYRQERLWKNSSCNKYITILKHISDYYKEYFKIDLELGRCLDQFPEEPSPEVDILSDKEMTDLANCDLKRSREQNLTNLRYKTAIMTLIYTGMRTGELCNLKWEDVKFKEIDYFLVHEVKNYKLREVPIFCEVKKLLDTLPKYSHGYIFGTHHGQMKIQTLNDELKKRCEKLGIKKEVTAKTFRHTMVTRCSVNGGEASLPKIARITGHSIETAYHHYMHNTLRELMDTIETTHPLAIKYMSHDLVRTKIRELWKLLSKTDLKIQLTEDNNRTMLEVNYNLNV